VYSQNRYLCIPDGALRLPRIPALLVENGAYVLKSHTISVSPSSTFYEVLEPGVKGREETEMPYLGVVAWTQNSFQKNPVITALIGPPRSELVPLPDSHKK